MSLIPVNIAMNGDIATKALVNVTYELGTLSSICYITYYNAGGRQIGYEHKYAVNYYSPSTQSTLLQLLLSRVYIQNLTRVILYQYELYSNYITLKYYTDTPSFYESFSGSMQILTIPNGSYIGLVDSDNGNAPIVDADSLIPPSENDSIATELFFSHNLVDADGIVITDSDPYNIEIQTNPL